jgi:hypothetical protein
MLPSTWSCACRCADAATTTRLLRRCLAVLSLGVALAPGFALANGFTIVDGQTVAQQVMADDGDIGRVETGGTVTVDGINAVEMNGLSQALTNYGTITVASGSGSVVWAPGDEATINNHGIMSSRDTAIYIAGDNSFIDNLGSVVTTGDNVRSLYGIGASSRIVNSGTIATYGSSGEAMSVSGVDATMTNRGTIESRGDGGYAMYTSGLGTTILNTGDITGFGYSNNGIGIFGANTDAVNTGRIDLGENGMFGLYNAADGTTITNSGLIETGGFFASNIFSVGHELTVYNSGSLINKDVDIGFALLSDGFNSRIYNSGNIQTDGLVAVTLSGAGGYIYNSGTISGARSTGVNIAYSVMDNGGYITGSYAAVSAFHSTLNFLAGSIVEGRVVLDGSNIDLGFGPGLNTVLTYAGSANTIESVNPYSSAGSTIAVLDRAGLVLSEDMILALTDGAGGLPQSGNSACLDQPGARQASASRCDVHAWVGQFGGVVDRDGQEDLAGRSLNHLGTRAGLEVMTSDTITGGVSVAAFVATGEVGLSQETSMSGGALGAHLRFDQGNFFADLSAIYGLLDITSTRSVADNTLSGGLTSAEATFNGSFFTPVLTAGADIGLGDKVLTPSVRLRYTQMSLDGYEETGANDNLVVDERTVSEFALRAQLALALVPMLTEDGTLTWTLRAGADGRRRTGDEVDANLLGSDISFATGSAGEAFGGFLGANLDYRLQSGVTVSGDIEYAADTAGSHATTARATLSAGF